MRYFFTLLGLALTINLADSFGPRFIASRNGSLRPSLTGKNSALGTMQKASNDNVDDEKSSTTMPRVIVFDLDGCLWRPEMYELIWFSGGRGAPFQPDPDVEGQLLTRGNEPVYLLGEVRQIMKDLWTHKERTYRGVSLGISSRTDEPNWARELLEKFEVFGKHKQDRQDVVTLRDVFGRGPIEIAKDSKVSHFQRISQNTGVPLENMLFFDNESGNCREVARLGVTVAYCPDGVTKEVWDLALETFPQSSGNVIGLDIYGYDTLEGANRFLS